MNMADPNLTQEMKRHDALVAFHQKVNRRDDRWLCADTTGLPTVIHTKFLSSVMVLGS